MALQFYPVPKQVLSQILITSNSVSAPWEVSDGVWPVVNMEVW